MQKVRVYQLAKELKVQSALILELLDRLGHEVKSDLSTLDGETADTVRKRVSKAIEAETRRLQKGGDSEEVDASAEESVAAESANAPEPPPAEEAPANAPAASKPAVAKPSAPAAARTQSKTRETLSQAPAAAAKKTPAPAAKKAPQTPPLGKPTDQKKVAAKPAPGTPGGAASKPGRRVFVAKRIPTAADLARSQAPRTRRPGGPGGAAGGPGGGPGGRPGAPRGAGVPPQNIPGGFPAGRTFGPGFGPGPGGAHGRPGGGHKKRRKKDKNKERAANMLAQAAAKPKADLPPVPEQITLSEGVTVKELAEKLNRKSKDVIAKLISRGMLATINQPLDPTIAIEVAEEFGVIEATVISYEEEAQQSGGTDPGSATVNDDGIDHETLKENLIDRAPVVTVMGHVDHGKTSLLDAIRKTEVADGEAGGITQHIGAYQVEARGRKITFLDTPGHEAFTMMRARGAKVTDVVVLVVAADDGVKPQTKEAINHAKAAEVPLVVAINKIDRPNAQPDRVKQQLMEHELVVEQYGGDTVACEVSAKQGTGLDELLEMILLVADVKETKADPTAPATGVVLESRLDRGRGILANVLVQSGTLRPGDVFIAGTAHGKVRAMSDAHGRKVKEAGPSRPVEVMGFAMQPNAGDSFQCVVDEAKARQISQFRQEKLRSEQQRKNVGTTLEMLSQSIAEGQAKELPVIIKTDVQGSAEAIRKSLEELPSDKIRINILSSGVGAISQADVLLATASKALVVGFNVRPDKTAQELAAQEKVQLRMYTIIYDLIDDIRAAMVGMLEPTIEEKVLGQAEVRETFKISRIGTIAGCFVTEGKVTRNAEVRLLRDNIVIHTGKVGTLRRFKDDVAEVKNGFECGIRIESYNDLKTGDVIEFFIQEKIAAESL